ncbi:MAG: hypothetical protein KGZ60_00190 [Truepera sp.]|nr:hypothetical protein [Truepera sp.]
MKKLLTTTILVAMIASLGAAFAQQPHQASHRVEVHIPSVLMIRITNGTDNAAVPSPDAVVFDLSSLAAADFEPADTYSPTNLDPAPNWNDVRVFANGGGWRVTVATDVGSHPTGVPTFDWSKVRVEPSGDDAIANFSLPAAGVSADIAGGPTATRTNGWLSLGFGPTDFRLHLDGTEEAGNYSATVTYTIAHP